MKPAPYFIESLNMSSHPEGGYFSETYRSAEIYKQESLPDRFSGNRNFSTAIYFLLEGTQFSSFHRIQSDEVWHFYYGQELNVYVIHPEGNLEIIRLGNDPENGSVFQATVKAGCWFASKSLNEEGFSLVGCTVSPGFDFDDFELAKSGNLVEMYPQHAEIIPLLCRN